MLAFFRSCYAHFDLWNWLLMFLQLRIWKMVHNRQCRVYFSFSNILLFIRATQFRINYELFFLYKILTFYETNYKVCILSKNITRTLFKSELFVLIIFKVYPFLCSQKGKQENKRTHSISYFAYFLKIDNRYFVYIKGIEIFEASKIPKLKKYFLDLSLAFLDSLFFL